MIGAALSAAALLAIPAQAEPLPFAPSAMEAPYKIIPYGLDTAWHDRHDTLVVPDLVVDIPLWRDVRSVLDVGFRGTVAFKFRNRAFEDIEVLDLFEVDVDPGPVEDRAAALEDFVFRGDRLLDAWRGENVVVHLTDRRIENGQPVIEVIATYDDRELGPAMLRVLAIPHPDQRRGLRLVARAALQGRTIQTIDEANDTLTGWVIERLTFRP
jgi:hypothetical protein